jgi:predicted CoA-binding protein
MAVTDAGLRDVLTKTRTIVVVGIKDAENEDAYRVPLYMQHVGYRIIPVNPKLETVLGERACARIADLPGPVDLINLFRAPEHIPAHVDEILALPERPAAVWMQLGIQHGESAERLRAEGIRVIQDRCIMVEHRRLLGDTGDA